MAELEDAIDCGSIDPEVLASIKTSNTRKWCLVSPLNALVANKERFEETRAIRIPPDAVLDFYCKNEKDRF